MKNPLKLLTFSLLITAPLLGQKQFSENNQLMPSKLLVSDFIRLDTSYLDDLKNQANYSSRLNLFLRCETIGDPVTDMLNQIQAGNITVYEPYNESDIYNFELTQPYTSATEIKQRLGYSESKTIDNDGVITTYGNIISSSMYVGFLFLEDWKVTENPFSFTKNIQGYIPIREDFDGMKTRLRHSVFLHNSSLSASENVASDKRMKLAYRVSYEYFLYPTQYSNTESANQVVDNKDITTGTTNAPYLTIYGINNFLNLILSKVKDGKCTASDLYSNKKLTYNELMKNLGEGDSYKVKILEYDGMQKDTTIYVSANLKEIKSLIFTENWYLDPQTLRMKKEVLSIAPVRYYYTPDDSEQKKLLRKIAFKILFKGN